MLVTMENPRAPKTRTRLAISEPGQDEKKSGKKSGDRADQGGHFKSAFDAVSASAVVSRRGLPGERRRRPEKGVKLMAKMYAFPVTLRDRIRFFERQVEMLTPPKTITDRALLRAYLKKLESYRRAVCFS